MGAGHHRSLWSRTYDVHVEDGFSPQDISCIDMRSADRGHTIAGGQRRWAGGHRRPAGPIYLWHQDQHIFEQAYLPNRGGLYHWYHMPDKDLKYYILREDCRRTDR